MSDPDTLKASRFGVTLGEVARLTIHLAEIIIKSGWEVACVRAREAGSDWFLSSWWLFLFARAWILSLYSRGTSDGVRVGLFESVAFARSLMTRKHADIGLPEYK